MNKIMEVLDRIIHVPGNFHRLGNISVFNLINEAQYLEVRDRVSEQDISDALTRYPEVLDDWMQYSEDKRSMGWYIVERPKGAFLVGYIGDRGVGESLTFANRKDACAAFIKREVDAILSRREK